MIQNVPIKMDITVMILALVVLRAVVLAVDLAAATVTNNNPDPQSTFQVPPRQFPVIT